MSLYSNAEESYRLQVTGDVNFGTSYNYKTNTFQVKIVSCRDLVPVDTKRNRSNPWVIFIDIQFLQMSVAHGVTISLQ